ncbi:MAG: hypothetical protein KatS3mg110_0068 [Pirellulaceae bacterium]|nr:MAG: hypothetical protein KatS3mg110_0068 [Pirellulaceae bacterium]
MSLPRRIVSLLPGATELVCVLGASDRLVAVSHECDYPPEIQHLPRVTRPRIDPHASSAEIDRQTKTLVEAGEPLFELDVECLENLRPDLIITQAQCDVCAIGEQDVKRSLVRSNLLCHVPTVALEADHLAAFFRDVQRLAGALGISQKGNSLLALWRDRIASVSQLVRGMLTAPYRMSGMAGAPDSGRQLDSGVGRVSRWRLSEGGTGRA